MAININISNYEEFLLSAVDGELNDEEQAALENFLQQHPEFRKELSLLQSARLMPDKQQRFEGREQLYRHQTALSGSNYESFLLDYVDNELSEADRLKVEALASQHLHISEELRLLQAARLQPELTLTFPDKSALYKHRNRVRPIWWWTAAAAVVAGIAVMTLPGKQTPASPQLAANNKQQVTPAAPQQAPAPAALPQATAPAANKTSNSDQLAASTPQLHKSNIKTAVTAPTESPVAKQDDNPASVALNKLPQPESTSGEIVHQLEEQKAQQALETANLANNEADKVPVLAKAAASKENTVNTRMPATTAPVQGELVVSVTMNGDSKILNGVANVARFFSRKKK